MQKHQMGKHQFYNRCTLQIPGKILFHFSKLDETNQLLLINLNIHKQALLCLIKNNNFRRQQFCLNVPFKFRIALIFNFCKQKEQYYIE